MPSTSAQASTSHKNDEVIEIMDSSDDDTTPCNGNQPTAKQVNAKGRRNIRKTKQDTELGVETREAMLSEVCHKKRLEENQNVSVSFHANTMELEQLVLCVDVSSFSGIKQGW